MDNINRRIALKGEPISSGKIKGRAYVFEQIDVDLIIKNSRRLNPGEIIMDGGRLGEAVKESVAQLREIHDKVEGALSSETADIFSAYIFIIEEDSFLNNLNDLITERKKNIESIVAEKIKSCRAESMKPGLNTVRKNVLHDMQDIYFRILRNLLGEDRAQSTALEKIHSPAILVSERLIPSDIALLDKKNILGILTEYGSGTSHIAIMSTAMGFPSITNVPGISTLVRNRDMIIMDGGNGDIIINPDAAELNAFRTVQRPPKPPAVKREMGLRIPGCRTKDKIDIVLEANAGTLEDVDIAFRNGAEGIGLLRSEIFYMQRKSIPGIEEESNFYKSILSIGNNRDTVVRLLDLGADKQLPYFGVKRELNSQLGTRGIRFLLKNPHLLKNQIESILRAARFGRISILIPFVTTMGDVEATTKIIREVSDENDINGNAVQIGIMVEVPSVALSILDYVDMVDFLSIGTNDLTQYVFAAGRENLGLSEYRQEYHPVILRLIKSVVDCASARGKRLSVCGEIASDTVGASLLVGLGVKMLSMKPSSLPGVRKFLSGKKYADLKEISAKSMSCRNTDEIKAIWNEYYDDNP